MSRFPTRRENLEWAAVQESGPEAVARFDKMLAEGQSVSMAAMLATQSPPRTGIDDRTVQANSKSVTEQFRGCDAMLNLYRQNYKAKTGENLPEDAVVYRGLAKYPGDPDCIVTHKHTLSDVKKAMRARNEQVEGDWEVHPVQAPPKPQEVLINDNVMARYKAEYRQLPEYEKATDKDLEAEITHKHTKVVTADDVMSTAKNIEEASKKVFGE
jgi:hypothetical protein